MFLFKKKEKVKEYRFKRIFLIVLDGVGIGEADDAGDYEDLECNSIKHALECTTHQFKHLGKLGLFNLLNDTNIPTNAYYCKGNPRCIGKDSLTGHLEMMGIDTKIPFKIFPNGFPLKLVKELEMKTGRKIIGNCMGDGNKIIEEFGPEHIRTGNIILYTSADSVLQIAAHESIVPLTELYHICEIAREITLKNDWKVGRVIARPFVGNPGNFIKTSNRKDYALNPDGFTVLDNLQKNNFDVLSVGKVSDIFNNKGITLSARIENNTDGLRKIMEAERRDFTGLCFINLNDFDSLYGHRRNSIGYADALREFDEALPHLFTHIDTNDLVIITSDHGNDPSYKGTDHTREKVPVFIYSPSFREPKRLNDLKTFADIGATISDNFQINKPNIGSSFLNNLK